MGIIVSGDFTMLVSPDTNIIFPREDDALEYHGHFVRDA